MDLQWSLFNHILYEGLDGEGMRDLVFSSYFIIHSHCILFFFDKDEAIMI